MPPHCDTLDGPVVKAAMRALEAQNVDLILPYVPKDSEAEVRTAYQQVMRVRKHGVEARELADRYFFETVVRIHRAGEGAPYTGLKPAGLDPGPIIPIAERAIERGVPDELLTVLAHMVQNEVKQRFERMMQLQRHAEHSVEAARAYVQAMLGLQVYAHTLYQRIKAAPHAEHHEHG
ncbi:MAG TPA: DUF6448 family protein [Roseiflexaceae bacterium]|nr:DUF6448 family protein [Roseiflexaceae bacterium]